APLARVDTPGGFAPPDPPAPSLAGTPSPPSTSGRARRWRGSRHPGGFAPPDPQRRPLAGCVVEAPSPGFTVLPRGGGPSGPPRRGLKDPAPTPTPPT